MNKSLFTCVCMEIVCTSVSIDFEGILAFMSMLVWLADDDLVVAIYCDRS